MADTPPLNPPDGTKLTTFWQSSGAKVAIVQTVSLALILVHARLRGIAPSMDAMEMGIDQTVFAWLTAFGIHASDKSSLRWT